MRNCPIETDRQFILRFLRNDVKNLGILLKNPYFPTVQRGLEAVSWLFYEGYIKGNIDERLLDFETEVWTNGEYENY